MATATGQSLRREVLDAAVQIVTVEGVGALSMREVARRAGVSHQAPYHHFSDRAAILGAIAEEGFDTLADRLQHALAAPGDPLESCFGAYVHTALDFPGHFRVMFRPELCDLADHAEAKDAADRAFASLLQLARRVAPRDADETAIATLSVVLWSQVHGLATLIIDGPLGRTMPNMADVRTLVADVGAFITRSTRHGIDN